jgi:hypothetical protein
MANYNTVVQVSSNVDDLRDHQVHADSYSRWSMRMCWLISPIMASVAGDRLVGSRVITAKVSISGGSRLTQVSFLV